MATLGNFVSGQVLSAAELNDIGTWTSFTPVFTNFTLGDGTVDAKYCQINDVVFVELALIFGSTSSLTGTLGIAFPVGTAAAVTTYRGSARLRDNDVPAVYAGVCFIGLSTRFDIYRYLVSGSNLTASVVNATTPFTWTTSDQVHLEFWYQKA